jgi:hypothetical protein
MHGRLRPEAGTRDAKRGFATGVAPGISASVGYYGRYSRCIGS